MDKRSRYINDALVKIYSDILWIEEKELKKSRFNDLTINCLLYTSDAADD